MKKIGAFVGKFYPPHIGHLSVVDNACENLDEVWVIISYNKQRNKQLEKTDGFAELDAWLIKKWFAQHYQNNPKVKVEVFDESDFKPYPQDRDKWAEKFKKQFPSVNVKIADASYKEYNKIYFPEYEFYEISRDVVPFHSTDFRQNPQQNLDKIIPEAQQYFKNLIKNKNYIIKK